MGWSPFRKTGLSFHMPSASCKGYTLVTPMGSDSTYLIDMHGQIVHRWHLRGLRQAVYAQLLPNGRLLAMATDASTPIPPPLTPDEIPAFAQHVRRIGGNANRLMEYDWDGNEFWRYENEYIHHDFVRLPGGTTLVTEFMESSPPSLPRSRAACLWHCPTSSPMTSWKLTRTVRSSGACISGNSLTPSETRVALLSVRRNGRTSTVWQSPPRATSCSPRA